MPCRTVIFEGDSIYVVSHLSYLILAHRIKLLTMLWKGGGTVVIDRQLMLSDVALILLAMLSFMEFHCPECIDYSLFVYQVRHQ